MKKRKKERDDRTERKEMRKRIRGHGEKKLEKYSGKEGWQ